MATYYADGTVIVGIWAQRSSGWQLVEQQINYLDGGPYTTGGPAALPFIINDLVINLGTNVLAVGVSIHSHNGTSATIDSFTKLAWQAQASSGGETSATPNGEKTTVVVTP